jgi:putative metallohydrolase (TIGR04338 family)
LVASKSQQAKNKLFLNLKSFGFSSRTSRKARRLSIFKKPIWYNDCTGEKMRDSQRRKVHLAISSFAHPTDRVCTNMSDVLDYVTRLFEADWFCMSFGEISRVTFRKARKHGNCWATRHGNEMEFCLPETNEYRQFFLLRLIAHGLIPAKSAWHGPEFCAIYLYLVQKIMGDAACSRLTSAFVRQKVDFRPNQKMRSVEGQIAVLKLLGRLGG